MESTPVLSDTQRLIGMLDTALQALLVSQQQQAALFARLQGGSSLPAAPVPAAVDTPPPAAPGPAAAPAEPAAPVRTLSDWLDIHWTAVEQHGYSPQTLRNRGACVAHCRRIWGSRPIAELRPHEITTGLKQFLPEHSCTAQRVLMELRAALNDAVANDWVQVNASTPVKVPVHKGLRKRLKFDTWVAMRTLAEASRQRWLQCMLLLGLMTGQRRADLAKMRFDDIVVGDDGAAYLRIEQQKKAGKDLGARIELPLSLRLDAIGMTLADVIELCRSCGKPGPTLLRTAGGKPIELSSLSARFNECIRAVVGPDAYKTYEWPSLHEVRSLAARLYRVEGHDVQTLLGHKDAEMTEVYLDDRGLTAAAYKRLELPKAADTPA